GEAERLIYHLNVSSENYDTAWEILVHHTTTSKLFSLIKSKYFSISPTFKNNHHPKSKGYMTLLRSAFMLFTILVSILMCGILYWCTFYVKNWIRIPRLITEKHALKPRKLPKLDELMTFLEGKFTALEQITKYDKEPATSIKRTPNPKALIIRNYQAQAIHISKCAVCNLNHNRNLFSCKKFINMTPNLQMRIVTQSNICKNCLFSHDGNECTSTKRCKSCQGNHHTILHEALDDEELLLTTLSINVRCSDGTYITLRALLDQGSQISLISENACND
ncbi:hypothetical protein HW555_007749, partial [Spodoptera exigua]